MIQAMKKPLRVALAQIATLPAYQSLTVDYMQEPAPPTLLKKMLFLS